MMMDGGWHISRMVDDARDSPSLVAFNLLHDVRRHYACIGMIRQFSFHCTNQVQIYVENNNWCVLSVTNTRKSIDERFIIILKVFSRLDENALFTRSNIRWA
jgi:hypothetical protein